MQEFKICSLYSGSRGNCTYISAGGANILVDAGKNAKALCSSLDSIGVGIDSIDAIFITHEHRDHISALQALSHKHSIPIYILLPSAEIFYGERDKQLFECFMIQLKDDFCVKIKELDVKAFPVPHDSRAAVGYRFTFKDNDGNDISIGYATDMGTVTDDVLSGLLGCRAVVIEANHDTDMLLNGIYPPALKKRIFSSKGHLSNSDCALLASRLCESGTEKIMLAHLSEANNTPELAFAEAWGQIADESITLKVAAQDIPVWLTENSEDNV